MPTPPRASRAPVVAPARAAWRLARAAAVSGALGVTLAGCSDGSTTAEVVPPGSQGGQTSQGGAAGAGAAGSGGAGAAGANGQGGGAKAGQGGAAGGAQAGGGQSAAGSAGAAGGGEGGEAGGPACAAVYAPCAGSSECCTGLSCGDTTAGKSICCGDVGTPCATVDGADCCGALLCVNGACAEDKCAGVYGACTDSADCCAGLSCGDTTAGKSICCGDVGTPCATADGADCCGALLCVGGKCSNGSSTGPLNFKAPFPCGQTWTYSHHSKEVRRALDFVNTQGGTDGQPVLASEAGVATRMYQAGGAGNYIVITHAGGWKTYYFHLSSYSVPSGASVKQGQEIGKVGSTGASSGPHLHYEQLLNGAGKDIVIDGKALAPYPGSYSQKSLTSTNCN